ncbi:MAG: hypothetical protein ACOC6Q_02475 [Patescibacteria group bacterium]
MTRTVTADISANQKTLRALEHEGLIEVTQIDIETPAPKTKKIKPTGVWGRTKWGKCVWGSKEESKFFEQIKDIIGRDKIDDAMHLNNHIRDRRDYFVTEDHDFLRHRGQLETTFTGLKIRTPNELTNELNREKLWMK